MKSLTSLFLFVAFLAFAMSGCGPSPSPTATLVTPTSTPVPPTATAIPPTPTSVLPTPTSTPALPTPTPVPPTPTPEPEGRTIVVTSIADSGPSTLRQALLDANLADTITFDPAVFPPQSPARVVLASCLPEVKQNHLTIDASNAGVILDGGRIGDEWCSGLTILSSWNTIRGLRFEGFAPGAGIELSADAQHNLIGGDSNIGRGPLGQGNMVGYGDLGLNISGEGTSFNTITDNFIGTDPSGADLGKTGTGIWISDGATDNTIGPGNTIAHNHTFGIEIVDAGTVGNTITQNSIHSNARGGVSLQGVSLRLGGNAGLLAPIITGFDLVAGTVIGEACVNCEVEFFSDENDQGRIYEGRATADSTGNFSFSRGAPFTGPHLTAMATDADGNTSEFSAPTSGSRRSIILQEGNNLPKTRLQTKRSRELADNRIAGYWHGLWQPFDYQEILDTEISGLGLKRVRLAINELDWDMVDWIKPEFSIDPNHDRWITSIAENDVTITYVLSFWDKEYRARGGEVSYPRFKTEDQIQRYLDFVRFIVHHFKDRVQYFEIWNEPNVRDSVQWIEVDDYIKLIERAVPIIRQEYPEAKIQVGGAAYLREPESRDYLFSILRSDIMPLVDVVSWHPMYGTSPEFDSEYYYEYPAIVQEIKDVASAHGFEGEYEADELTWYTIIEGTHWDGWSQRYSDTIAAKYYARGIVMHLGMDVTAGTGGLSSLRQVSFPTVRNLCTIMTGARPVSLPMEIQSEATNIRSYSFSLPNGDHLVALWTDGVAVEDDPGVPATLTIQDLSAQKVVGIDVLNGFEQQLIAGVEDGNLVVHDLLVKDYPTILRLAK